MAEPLLPRTVNNNIRVEMGDISRYVRWLWPDRSSDCRSFVSFGMYLVFGIVVPAFSAFHYLSSSTVIQISLYVIATLSYFTLSSFAIINLHTMVPLPENRDGMHKVLLLDNLDENHVVRQKYIQHLNMSLKWMFLAFFPFFVIRCICKNWLYVGGGNIVFISNVVGSSLESISWLYVTIMFFIVCTMFRHVHYVQKVRVDEFNNLFTAEDSNLKRMLKDYSRILDDMSSINTTFSRFFSSSLICILCSQLIGLLSIKVEYNPSHSRSTGAVQADLLSWSMTLTAGLVIMLSSAINVSTSMKQIRSFASRWHVRETFSTTDPPYSNNVSTVFQERQALVNCFAQNPMGMVILGVELTGDRLQLIFLIVLGLFTLLVCSIASTT